MATSARVRGALVVLEGGDRCGKSTQARRLVDRLLATGNAASLLRFPDRSTATGKIIDAYLSASSHIDDRSLHLLFAANRWECVLQINSLLAEGTTVVLDRYAYSGVAFSAAKGLDLAWCRQPDVGLPKPDVVLFLDLDCSEAAKRGGYGEERYENVIFQERVRAIYLNELRDPTWKVLDAAKSMNDLHTDIYNLVNATMTTAADCPIDSLWT